MSHRCTYQSIRPRTDSGIVFDAAVRTDRADKSVFRRVRRSDVELPVGVCAGATASERQGSDDAQRKWRAALRILYAETPIVSSMSSGRKPTKEAVGIWLKKRRDLPGPRQPFVDDHLKAMLIAR